MKKMLCIFISILFIMNIFSVAFANTVDIIDLATDIESIEEVEIVDETDIPMDIDENNEFVDDIDLMSVDYTGLVEIGKNAPAFASSTTLGHEAFYGNDGDTSTYWQKHTKGSSTAERYFIALPKAVPIKAITYIADAAGNGNNVKFYLSNDGEFNVQNKVLVGSSTTDSVETEIAVNNSNAFKYVLLEKYWTNADDYAAARTPFTVAELKIYTDAASAEGIVSKNAINIALNKTVTASGVYGGLSADRVTNNNYRDEWATNSANSTWVMIDLGAEYSIEYIVMNSGHVVAKDSPENHLTWRSGVTFMGSNDGNLKSADAVTLHVHDGPIAENSGLMSCDVYDPSPAQSTRRPSADATVSGTVVYEVDEAVKGQRFRYVGFTAANRIDVNNMEIYTTDTVLDNFTVTETDSQVSVSSNVKGVNETELQFMAMFNDAEGKYAGSSFDSVADLKIGAAVSANLAFTKPANANEADVVMFKNFANKSIIRVFDNLTDATIPEEENVTVTTTANVSALTKAEDIVVSGVTEGDNVMLWVMPYGDSSTIDAPTAQQMIDTADALNSSNFNDSVMQAYLVSSNDGKYSKSFNMSGYPAGWYMVKAVFDKDVAEENTVDCFYFISAAEDAAIADAFAEAEAGEVAGLLETYLASFVGYDEKFEAYGEDAGRYFTIARTAFLNGDFTGEAQTIESIADVKSVFDVAFTVAELMTNDEFLSAENFDAGDISVLTDAENYNAEEIEEIFAILLKNIENVIADTESTDEDVVNEMLFNFEKAQALSLIYKGSYSEIEDAITDYQDVLGIEGEDIYDDVNTLSVAKNLGNSLSDIKGYAEGMQSAIEDAIEEAKDVDGSETVIGGNNNDSGSRGGSRGGGGRSSSGGTITTPDEKDEPVVAPKSYFNDLAGFDWAAKSINTLYEKEVIEGSGDGKFNPGNTINREEITKMVVKAFYMDNIVDLTKLGSNGFEDCDVNEWYYPYVTIAKTNGVIAGISATEFGVGQYLTREDLAVIIKRVMDTKIKEAAEAETPIDVPSVTYESPSDSDEVSSYAIMAVDYALETGVLTGYEDGTVRPLNPVSRAEAAVILDRVMTILGR